ncbi:hypothetical protein GOBAR_AA35059 [Gossypium barbadense]|uniref:Uncharacterized protein n=1 Tax=Gossypium barbadense TaxID=3634 RepID=A0A2P5W3H2_GOSBA|nr:hypothetical protein GOBAR_AA35059 [Gossypium barbadense]
MKRDKKGALRSNGKDMASYIETRLVKVQQAITSVLDRVEDPEGRMDGLEMGNGEFCVKPKKELMEKLQGVLSAKIGDLNHKNETLEDLVEVMCNEIVELKGELIRLKTIGGMLGTSIHH